MQLLARESAKAMKGSPCTTRVIHLLEVFWPINSRWCEDHRNEEQGRSEFVRSVIEQDCDQSTDDRNEEQVRERRRVVPCAARMKTPLSKRISKHIRDDFNAFSSIFENHHSTEHIRWWRSICFSDNECVDGCCPNATCTSNQSCKQCKRTCGKAKPCPHQRRGLSCRVRR